MECNKLSVFPVPVFGTSIAPQKYCLPKSFILGVWPVSHFLNFFWPFWQSNHWGGSTVVFQTFCPGADHAGGYLNVCIRLLLTVMPLTTLCCMESTNVFPSFRHASPGLRDGTNTGTCQTGQRPMMRSRRV